MRLIVDSGDVGTEDERPYLNMALDEALFRSFLSGESESVWRCYDWAVPAATFGRNVEYPTGLDGMPVIRRISGGGVVPHGEDLTYAVIRGRKTGSDNYRDITELLSAALRKLGVECGIWDEKEIGKAGVCFASLAPFDIHYGGRKIAGCAQRRKKNGILHHGSIAIGIPDTRFGNAGYFIKDSVLTLNNFISVEIGWDVLAGIVRELAPQFLGESMDISNYTEKEIGDAFDLIDKYRSLSWNNNATE